MAMGTVNIGGKEYEIPEETEYTFGDARAVKEATGYTWGEWFVALGEGDIFAMGGLAYLLLKRDDATVTPEDIDRIRIVDFMVEGSEDDEESAEGNDESGEQEAQPSPNGKGTSKSAKTRAASGNRD